MWCVNFFGETAAEREYAANFIYVTVNMLNDLSQERTKSLMDDDNASVPFT